VDRDHVYDLWSHGCRDIIRETYDSSLRMGRSAFEALGIEHGLAQRMIDAFNATDRKAMIEVAAVHKVGVPPHENEEYIAKVREMRGLWGETLRNELDAIRAAEPES
jgi:CPA2 family monovalent cation:H+ antiporter-2